MTGQDPWSDWAADWRAGGPETPDFEALERTIRRRRRSRQTQRIIDLLASMSGIGISGWAIWLGAPAGVIVGLAGLAFSLFGLALALGGQFVPRMLNTRTVVGALTWEISAARAGIRASLGGVMIAVGALLFLLICLVVYQQAGILTRTAPTGVFLVGGALFAIASGAASLVLLRCRRARLRTLEGLLADLEDEA